MRTTTLVEAPVQPERTLSGSIGSEKVSVIESPISGRPATPALAVCTSVPDGCVLSTVTLKPEVVPLLPATSVAVMV